MANKAQRVALVSLFALPLAACTSREDAAVFTQSDALVFTLNGLTAINGLSTSNGLSSGNGLSSANGLSTSNGLSSANGLSTSNGLMTTVPGRMTVEYMVRCALALGDTLTKQDQNGASYTFLGQLGLAPQWKTGTCDATCQQMISSCMLAHVNTSGVHIPLWLVSANAAIGWGQNPQYPSREGTFFGNIFNVNSGSGVVDAFYCNGPGFSTNTVPGRLGAAQVGAPYTDPYLSTTNVAGTCSPCSSTRTDGPDACKADAVTFKSPITVWRGQTFQAENAVLSNALTPILCAPGVCSNDYRVGYIGPHSTVTFNGVFSATEGPHVLIIYYANGDACGSTPCARYFNVSVNGGLPQLRAFPVVKGGNWNVIGSQPILLAGFVAGTTNTITFTGDKAHAAPDLDWVEIE
jgi:hypothetical protein